ncbi:pilus assembly PilX family protein [Luteimonas padinae]|nr:PilX N-terminal domain-containing pilus assembly protein [Luteimonas padinae]
MTILSRRAGAASQGGAVLVIALILLAVLTLLALGGLRGTVMEERMAAGQRDRSLEFQAAEAGLRAAEAVIQADTTSTLGQDCISGTTAAACPTIRVW